MNRKQFIESQEATCANWNWSWSFVNHAQRFVIFGLWSHHLDNDEGLILSSDWERNASGRKNPGFKQSVEHARLVAEEGFTLLTFPMFAEINERGELPSVEPVKIDHFQPILQRKLLVELHREWFAVETPLPPANSFEPLLKRTFEEGDQSILLSKHIERCRAARTRCLEVHGYQCKVCWKSMSDRYGEAGDGIIEVHHLHEMSQRDGRHRVDPETDLVPVCPNCHRIIHTRRPALSLCNVRKIVKNCS